MSPSLQGTRLSVCSNLCWQGVLLRCYLSKSRSSSLRNHYYRKRSTSRDRPGKSRCCLLNSLQRQYHANVWRSFCRQPVRGSFIHILNLGSGRLELRIRRMLQLSQPRAHICSHSKHEHPELLPILWIAGISFRLPVRTRRQHWGDHVWLQSRNSIWAASG